MSVSQNLKIIEVAGSVNVAANTSQVRVIWESTQQGLSYNDYTRTAKLYLSVNGGAETEYSINYTLPRDSTVTIVDKTITVTHKDDGTGRVQVRTWMDTGISAGVLERSKTLDLTTISRASSISRIESRALGKGCYVQWTPNSEDFIFKLNFSLGTWSYTTDFIKPNQTTLYTYKDYILPMEVAEQIPNAATAEMKVILATFNDGGTQIGYDAVGYFEITVPNNATTQPTVDMSLSPLNTGLPSKYNSIYIQGLSKLKTNIAVLTKYKADVAATTVTVDGTAYNIDKPEILTKTGKLTVKATVKDTRGYYGTDYEDINVIAYQKPYITAKSNESKIIVARCDASANLTNSGKYLKIKAKVAYSKVVSGGVQRNYAFIKYRYRKEGGTYSGWNTILDCKTDNSDEVITAPLLNGALDVKSNYQVQIIATDDFGESVPITFSISSDAVFMDRPAGGKSMGLGGYSSGDGNLDIHWKTKARGGLSLFDAKGDEIPLDSTMPLPRGQLAAGYNPDALENGVHIVANSIALKSGDTIIMYNGVLIQMAGDTGSNVKIQLALPVDNGRYPRFRVCWYSTWSDWRTW